MKICPKCGFEHSKSGKFCSRSCANSRGPRTEAFKITVSEKLKGRLRGRTVNQKTCPISGEIILDTKEYKTRKWRNTPAGKFRTIQLLAKTFDIQLGQPKAIEELDKVFSMLYKSYHVENLSSKVIRDRFGFRCSTSHIPNMLKSLGISRRTFSESQRLALLLKRSTIPSSQSYRSGWFEDQFGVKHFYRSSYELEIYKFLNDSNIRFLSEYLRIEYFDTQENQTRIAVPDILVGNRIIEVKSNYTYDRQNMIDKVRAYFEKGYDFSLILEHKEYIIDQSNYMGQLP